MSTKAEVDFSESTFTAAALPFTEDVLRTEALPISAVGAVGADAASDVKAYPTPLTPVGKVILRARNASPLFVVLLVLLLLDLAFSIVFAAIPDSRPGSVDTSHWSKLENAPSVELMDSYIQLFLAFLIAICSAICLYLGYRLIRYRQHHMQVLMAIMLLKILSLFCDIMNLAEPNRFRLIYVVIEACIRGLEITLVAVLILWNRSDVRVAPYESQLAAADEEVQSDADAQRLMLWMEARDVRRYMHNVWQGQRKFFIATCLLLVLLVVGNTITEFAHIITYQNSFFTSTTLNSIHQQSTVTSSFGAARTQNDTKVLLVILDGLRYDYLYRNPDMAALLSSTAFAEDSRVYHMQAQLPSMSVPNWLTLLTGAPPELTGTMGNLLTPETEFDSIFRQARIYDVNRGMTASPWMAGIVSSQLPYLQGDGTIATSAVPFGETARSKSIDPADRLRADVVYQALQQTAYPYGLFLAHFSDIDGQGHDFGVSTRWNKADSYQGAVTNKTRILERIVQMVDNNTLVVVTADHGHVDRGGHGGVNADLLSVPLIFYKKGSGFNATALPASSPRFNQTYSNVDVSVTIAAVLGMPVPRESLGRFVDDAMIFAAPSAIGKHYHDLFVQKQTLVRQFALNSEVLSMVDIDYPVFWNDYPTDTQSVQFYVNGVNTLLDIYANIRQKNVNVQVVRNVLVTVIVVAVCVFALTVALQLFSFADIMSVRVHGVAKPNRWTNFVALVFGFFANVLYICIGIALYNAFEYVNGYSFWDSTVIHTPAAFPFFIGCAVIPTMLMALVILRAGRYMGYAPADIQHNPDAGTLRRALDNIAHHLLRALFGYRARYSNYGLTYLCKHYVMYFAVLTGIALLFFQCGHAFSLPLVFRIYFVTPATWIVRFRVVSVQIMCMPMILLAFFDLLTTPNERDDPTAIDSIYMLKIAKDERLDPKVAEAAVGVAVAVSSYSELFKASAASDVHDFSVGREILSALLRRRRRAASTDSDPKALMQTGGVQHSVNALNDSKHD